jgi:hypothetical protein
MPLLDAPEDVRLERVTMDLTPREVADPALISFWIIKALIYYTWGVFCLLCEIKLICPF